MKITRSVRLISIYICLIIISISLVPLQALADSPAPRPAPGGSSGGDSRDSKHGGGSDSPIPGDIFGGVIDQSTGLPGAGLTVIINDIPIRTDTSGHYSLTGIADGSYIVDLSLPAEFTPAQSAQTVIVANRSKVEVNLEYYSLSPPALTSTTQTGEAAQLNPSGTTNLDESDTSVAPQVLPTTGGVNTKFFSKKANSGLFMFFLGTTLLFFVIAVSAKMDNKL